MLLLCWITGEFSMPGTPTIHRQWKLLNVGLGLKTKVHCSLSTEPKLIILSRRVFGGPCEIYLVVSLWDHPTLYWTCCLGLIPPSLFHAMHPVSQLEWCRCLVGGNSFHCVLTRLSCDKTKKGLSSLVWTDIDRDNSISTNSIRLEACHLVPWPNCGLWSIRPGLFLKLCADQLIRCSAWPSYCASRYDSFACFSYLRFTCISYPAKQNSSSSHWAITRTT